MTWVANRCTLTIASEAKNTTTARLWTRRNLLGNNANGNLDDVTNQITSPQTQTEGTA
jgi:hypothetical protein